MKVSLRVKFVVMITAVVIGMGGLILFVVGMVFAQELNRSVHAGVRATSSVLVQIMHERSTALKSQCLAFARQPVFKAYFAVSDLGGSSSPARPDAATIADSL